MTGIRTVKDSRLVRHVTGRLSPPPLLPCTLQNTHGTFVLATAPVRNRNEAAEIRAASHRERLAAGFQGRAHAIVFQRDPAEPVAFVFQQRRGEKLAGSFRSRMAAGKAVRRIRDQYSTEQPATIAAFSLLAHLCPGAVAILDRSAPDQLTSNRRSIFYEHGPRGADGREIVQLILEEVERG